MLSVSARRLDEIPSASRFRHGRATCLPRVSDLAVPQFGRETAGDAYGGSLENRARFR